jgi:hypothetical protein
MITEKEKEEITKEFKPVIDLLLELLSSNKNYDDKIRGIDFISGFHYVYNEKNEPVDQKAYRFISFRLREDDGKSVFTGERLNFSY